jgi:hypothetical protein
MIFCLTFTGLSGCGQKKTELVNVSYDATREFYKEYNRLFEDYWYGKTGEKVEVIQSHGGSGKQALEVANGLGADVVTLALEGDVNVIRDEGLIDDGYINDYSDDSSPYTSTIVFLVRKGNPKNIKDWDDLLTGLRLSLLILRLLVVPDGISLRHGIILKSRDRLRNRFRQVLRDFIRMWQCLIQVQEVLLPHLQRMDRGMS